MKKKKKAQLGSSCQAGKPFSLRWMADIRKRFGETREKHTHSETDEERKRETDKTTEMKREKERQTDRQMK